MKNLIRDQKQMTNKKIIIKGNLKQRSISTNKKVLDPNYIAGFVQADGSFHVALSKDKRYKWGLRLRPKFTLTQKENSAYVLEDIKNYFGCGRIDKNVKKGSKEYIVETNYELETIIIPFFEKYPVYESKQRALAILKEVIGQLKHKEHHFKSQFESMLHKIFNMSDNSNRTEEKRQALFEYLGWGEYKDKYIDTHEYQYPPFNGHFIMGLIDGDGSFHVTFHTNKVIRFAFQITQDRSEQMLLYKIKDYFQCGGVDFEGANIAKYRVTGTKDIQSHIIPFAEKYPLHTLKVHQYEAFKKACDIFVSHSPLSDDDRLKIIDLTYNIYEEGKKREMTKEEYIISNFPNHPRAIILKNQIIE